MTGEQIYELALALIDEVTESGTFSPDNPEYYKKKAVSFLTILQAELLPITQTPTILKSLSDSLLLDNRICTLVLPYGLASHLLMAENPSLASFLNARYDELKRKQVTEIQPITDVYSVLSGMQ
jgi:hypothetical protein